MRRVKAACAISLSVLQRVVLSVLDLIALVTASGGEPKAAADPPVDEGFHMFLGQPAATARNKSLLVFFVFIVIEFHVPLYPSRADFAH